MKPKADNLHDSLQRKDHGEYNIEDLQYVSDHVSLVVVLDGHRDHVQHDGYHNTQLELGTDGYVIEYCLEFVLENM